MKRFREDWTDNLAFVGLSQREAEQDYYDLRKLRPEWFLGYCVFVGGLDRHRWQGLRFSRAMITRRAAAFPPSYETQLILAMSLARTGSARQLEYVGRGNNL